MEFLRQLAQMEVMFFVVPRNHLRTRPLFSMLVNPRDKLVIGSAGGDERAKVLIINLGKF
jgi:hypothetical protein